MSGSPYVRMSPLVLDPDEVAPPGFEFIRQQPVPRRKPIAFGVDSVPPPPQLRQQSISMQPQFRPRVGQELRDPSWDARWNERRNSYFKHTPRPDRSIPYPEVEIQQPPAQSIQPQAGYRFDDPVEQAIAQAAQQYGVDPRLMRAFARIESGGNPAAQTGSYKGLFQLSDREGRGDLFDPVVNASEAARNFQAQIASFKKQYGRDPSPTDLYMIHQQGVGGAAAHMANPDAPAWQNMYSTAEGRQKGENWAKRAIWGNVPDDVKDQFPGGVEELTSRQFMDLWDAKMRRFGGYSDQAPPSQQQAAGEGIISSAQAQPRFQSPTEQDLAYLEQHPELIDKFEKRFGPANKYFDIEEAADTEPLEGDDFRAASVASGLDSALMGLGDEIVPGVMSMLPGRGTYDEEQKMYRGYEDRLAANNPGWDTALRVGGAVAGGPLKLAKGIGSKLTGDILTKPSLLKKALGLAAGGGATGAIYGHNEGEGDFLSEDRLKNAIGGGVTGAMLGPALGGAIGGTKNVFRAFKPKPIADKVAARLSDPVLADIKRNGGLGTVEAGESLINQTGARTGQVASELAGSTKGKMARDLAAAITSTGFNPSGSNLLRWAHSWFKSNREYLTPKQRKEAAELLMNPKRLEEAMTRIKTHRQGELSGIREDLIQAGRWSNTATGVAEQKKAQRKRLQ